MATDADIARLRQRVRGRVVAAEDADWDEARTAWNLLIDQRPAAVALPQDDEDVAAIVRWAAAAGLRVSAQTTGHRAGTIGDLADTVLIKTERLDGIRVDPDRRSARVGAGVVWGAVIEATAPLGLAPLSGTASSVGVAGYCLGGGIGWLSRQYGLACNHVTAIDIVTADGRQRHVDASQDPDLFWALRGGGGDFAIVTGLELRLFPVEALYGGAFFWPADRAPEIFATWASWTEQTPDELSSCARFFNFPPLPFIPEPFRGRSLVSVEIAFNGPAEQGQGWAQPFLDLDPEMGGCDTMPIAALVSLHQDPPNPGPSVGDGALIERLDAATLAAFCTAAMSEAGRRLVSIEVRQTGGALAEPAADAGVLAALPGAYAVYAAGLASPAADPEALHAAVQAIQASVRPAAPALGYSNFSHQPGDLSAFFAAPDITRLRDVKHRYDPADVIRGTNAVP